MPKLMIATSPLTGNIYAGVPLKSGVWGTKKTDVTDSAVGAVAQHLLHRDETLLFEYRGKKYQMQVSEITNP